MDIYTIGFTKRTAENFFETLKKSGAAHLLDIRLNNTSQLAAFTKKQDLPYLLRKLTGMEYHAVPELAQDDSILKEYRRTKNWKAYEDAYNHLLIERKSEKSVPVEWLKGGAVLLCSEYDASKCHRRLAAEYLAKKPEDKLTVTHL
jgi:uncharacterized protein (DUF488 family)